MSHYQQQDTRVIVWYHPCIVSER